jgi:MFS family permease
MADGMSASSDLPLRPAPDATTVANRAHDRGRVRRLAAARVVSAGGSQAAQIALIFEIYDTTGSGLWVVAALFASISVGGLLGPLSGWVADRFDRRRVMILSELSAGAVYGVLTIARAPAWLVVGALAATVLGAPFRAASAAAIPNLVEPEDLAWANGLLATAFNVALVVGPFVGGALVAVSGASLVFAVNAVSFVLSAALIAPTDGAFGGRRRAGATGRDAGELLAGFRLLLRDAHLGPLAMASALAFGAFGASLVIDPALAESFDAGSVGYGLLTATWGAGAVVGAVIAGRMVRVEWAPKAVVRGMAAMAVSLASIVVLPTFALIVAAGTIGGIGNGFVFVPWLLLVQHHTADAVRGRVIAAAEAFDQVTFLAGMGLAVPAVALVGPQWAYGIPGLLLAAAVVAAARAAREA